MLETVPEVVAQAVPVGITSEDEELDQVTWEVVLMAGDSNVSLEVEKLVVGATVILGEEWSVSHSSDNWLANWRGIMGATGPVFPYDSKIYPMDWSRWAKFKSRQTGSASRASRSFEKKKKRKQYKVNFYINIISKENLW